MFTQFCVCVSQVKTFSVDTKFGDFIVHWSIAALKVFKENLSTNFSLIAVFVKVALEITKRAQHCVWLIHMFSRFFEIAQVFSRFAGWRVYKAHLQNERVIKTFRKHPKSSKFVYIKSSLQFMHNLYPFCRKSKISRNSPYRFLWNFRQQKTITQSIRSVKAFPKKMPLRADIRFRAKTIVTSLSRDIYSDRPKTNIIIKLSVCVIHVL